MALVAKLYGTTEVKANLRKWANNMEKNGKASIKKRWQRVLDRARNEFVPVDKHDLQQSGRLVVSEHGLSVTIVFGGPGIHYAIAVHEHLSEHSPPSWRIAESSGRGIRWSKPGTGPKYVERPMMEELPHLPKLMQQDLRVEKAL